MRARPLANSARSSAASAAAAAAAAARILQLEASLAAAENAMGDAQAHSYYYGLCL